MLGTKCGYASQRHSVDGTSSPCGGGVEWRIRMALWPDNVKVHGLSEVGAGARNGQVSGDGCWCQATKRIGGKLEV